MSMLLYYDLPRLSYFQKEWLKPNGYSFVRVEMDESDKFWWKTYREKDDMVNTKDIMLGNFVKDKNGEIILVGKVHRDSVADKWGRLVFDDEIEPIPETVDRLKRIGFKEDTTAGEPWPFWRYWDKEGRYKLDVYPDELYCNSDRKFGLHVDNDVCNTIGSGEFTYVHELQNLTRCITGHSLLITKEVFDGLGNES